MKGRRDARGFTLLEILLATSLLAAALALAFGILRSAAATSERGNLIARRNERMQAVTAFLRRRIGDAQGTVFGFDPQTGQSLRFSGDARHMRFVAEQPNYLGQGGPHLHELQVVSGPHGEQLRVSMQMLQAGELLPAVRPPEPLAEALTSATFSYRSMTASGQWGRWQSSWQLPESLPLQVRVQLADRNGAWPEVVVTLRMAGNWAALSAEPVQ